MMATPRCILEVPMIEFLGIFLIYITSIIIGFCRFYWYNIFVECKDSVVSILLGFDFNSKSCGFLSSIFKIVCAVSQSSSLELELPAQALVSSSSETSGLLLTMCTLFTLLVDATWLVCVSSFTLWFKTSGNSSSDELTT